MNQTTAYKPSERVSATGIYMLMTPDGIATTVRSPAFAGTACPVAPPGWTWQLDPTARLPAD